jgi:hypothetical protein
MVLKGIYELWGEIYQEEELSADKELEGDALSSFLSSSLNVELVYIILLSITTFSQSKKVTDDIKVVDDKGRPTRDEIEAIDMSERDPKKLQD